MHIIRLIMEIESKLTFQRVIKPTTPNSMDKMENATHNEQMGLGIKNKETNIIITAATLQKSTR